MHAGSHFSLKEALLWTRRDLYKFLLISLIATFLYDVLDWKWISIPWLPIALIGTAVAFLIGFKNNSTYDRLWEARKVWGMLVNVSRTWGVMSRDFVSNHYAREKISESELDSIHHRLVYRHLVWLTCLRYELRKPRAWETMTKASGREFKKRFVVPEERTSLRDALSRYQKVIDLDRLLSASDPTTLILSEQSKDVLELYEMGLIDDFRHVELEKIIARLYDLQGACERIKNFPYPRQFATTNQYFVWIFLVLLPFGMIQEFEKLGEYWIWMTIPFSVLVSWV